MSTTFNVDEALSKLTLPHKIKLLSGLVSIFTCYVYPPVNIFLGRAGGIQNPSRSPKRA